MANNFDKFFTRVLADEGTKYEDVPGDNGGPTKCGITIADVARWNGVKLPKRGAKGWDVLVEKVRALDKTSAGEIYKKFYWDEVRGDDLPSGLDYAVVDYAVNSGTGRAIPTLGRLVGCSDGSVTDEMLDAVRRYGSLADLIEHYQDERRRFLTAISDASDPRYAKNAKFRRGWLDREARVRKVALKWASDADPLPPIDVVPKATSAISQETAPTCAALAQVSRKASILEWVKLWSGVGGIGAASMTASGTLGFAKELSDNVKTLMADHMLLIIFLICAGIGLGAWLIQRMMVQDVAEGRYIPSKGTPNV